MNDLYSLFLYFVRAIGRNGNRGLWFVSTM